MKLKLLPKGPEFWLDRLIEMPAPVHVLRVGSGKHNDIVVDQPGVTDTHCLVQVTRGRVEVCDFGHPGETLVNQVAVTDGHAILHPNSVLRLGRKGPRLTACSAASDASPEMVVRNLYQLVQEHDVYFPNPNRAAKKLGTSRSTLLDWFEKHRFRIGAATGLVLMLGGWHLWFAQVQTPQHSKAPVLQPTVPEELRLTTAAGSSDNPAPATVRPTTSMPVASATPTTSDTPPAQECEVPAAEITPEVVTKDKDRSCKLRKARTKKRRRRPATRTTEAPPTPQLKRPERPAWVMSSVQRNEWRPMHRIMPAHDDREGGPDND